MEIKGLGFDIREISSDYISALWSDKRRSELLLNSTIEWPLTIDKNLWWSVFTYFGENNKKAESDPTTISIKEDDMEWRHNMLGYWQNYNQMLQFFFERKRNIKRGIPIYVEIYLVDKIPKEIMLEVILEKNFITEQRPSDFIFLGFDIAHDSFISGLTNCGYSEKDKKELINSGWLNKLNENGLIKNLEDAIEYKKITDKRVNSLAPFFVYAIYKAPEILIAK